LNEKVKLEFITTREVEQIPEDFFRQNFPQRFERSLGFRQRADQLRCIGAGVLLHKVLGIREEELKRGPYGKPFAEGREGDFNLSHSGDLIVLAVSDTKVGVDVERIDRRHTDIASRVFTPEEIKWMREPSAKAGESSVRPDEPSAKLDEPSAKEKALPERQADERFFYLWTLKEAVMKAEGKGFSLPPESFSVLPLIQERKLHVPGILENSYSGFTIKKGDYIVSCVTADKEAPVQPGQNESNEQNESGIFRKSKLRQNEPRIGGDQI